jgi:hypothetical protein
MVEKSTDVKIGERVPLSALVVSSKANNKPWYVIILIVLIFSLLVRRFIKIKKL